MQRSWCLFAHVQQTKNNFIDITVITVFLRYMQTSAADTNSLHVCTLHRVPENFYFIPLAARGFHILRFNRLKFYGSLYSFILFRCTRACSFCLLFVAVGYGYTGRSDDLTLTLLWFVTPAVSALHQVSSITSLLKSHRPTITCFTFPA